jgi:RNA polymerase sigma-70 factor, ECF subfamily
LDEHEAIRRCQGGDEQAFRYLMDTHKDRAFRIACKILGDHGTAEDATQEAFVSAWRSIHTFEVGQPFAPWLLTILIRCAFKRLPKNSIQVKSLTEEDCPDPQDPAPGPEQTLAKEEVFEIVRKALTRLSAQRSRIIRLYYDVELKISEIADLLELPEGTVKSEMHRAKQELSQILKGILDR